MKNSVIKRLEVIKNLIYLEEFETIPEQVGKIIQLELFGLSDIIEALNSREYFKALELINNFLFEKRNISCYDDIELKVLRSEISVTARKIAALEEEKSAIGRIMHKFEARYHFEIGELIEKILKLKKERLKTLSLHNSVYREEYLKAEHEYYRFYFQNSESEENKIYDLMEDEMQLLKLKFRQASKLCHPDLVVEDQRDEAANIFCELKAAYDNNDLKTVSEILILLEEGERIRRNGNVVTDKERLKNALRRLRLLEDRLISDLTKLKKSESFTLITSIKSWDEYFSNLKSKLVNELDYLKTA